MEDFNISMIISVQGQDNEHVATGRVFFAVTGILLFTSTRNMLQLHKRF